MERGQDARLVPLVLEVMAEAKTDFPQLDRLAVTRGPGSFTGLRIGLAATRGFGLAADKPVIGIDRFSLYREQQFKKPSPLAGEEAKTRACASKPLVFAGEGVSSMTPPRNRKAISTLPQGEGDSIQKTYTEDVFVVLDSKRLELFCRHYPAKGAAHEACMMTPDEIATLTRERPSLVVCGDALELLRPHLPPSVIYSNATESEVVTCAALAALADPHDPAYLPRPLYLRAPDVTIAKSFPERCS